jgi:hypothetical protein
LMTTDDFRAEITGVSERCPADIKMLNDSRKSCCAVFGPFSRRIFRAPKKLSLYH